MKVLFVAIIMAIVFSPLHKRLSRIFRIANIAALVTTVLAILECCMATGIGTGSTPAAAWFCARPSAALGSQTGEKLVGSFRIHELAFDGRRGNCLMRTETVKVA